MNTPKTVYAFHLLNDLSGSPKVLSQLLKGWIAEGVTVHLYTNLHQKGFLSDIPGVHYHNAWYRFSPNPWIRLLLYSLSQLILFFKLAFQLKSNSTVYINTVLPFGAALAAKMKRCRIIYHIHESTVSPPILKWFLLSIVRSTASAIINVSEFVRSSHGISTVTNYLVYNAIEDRFLNQVPEVTPSATPSKVLMVCSLKIYKGVFEFINLATRHSEFQFRLVLNATQADIDRFFQGRTFPGNLEIFSSQTNLHPFFQWADLIVNLSRPDGWVETFGLTIIEGMAYGLPALVPPVGGILEVIEEGKTGFSVDSRNAQELDERFLRIMRDRACYQSFALEARQRLQLFSEKALVEKTLEILNKE